MGKQDRDTYAIRTATAPQGRDEHLEVTRRAMRNMRRWRERHTFIAPAEAEEDGKG